METLTEFERGLVALALQGLVMRQPHITPEVLTIIAKLGLMEKLTKNLQSWIAWSEVHPPFPAALMARLPVAACPDEAPIKQDGRLESWGHPLDEPRYVKPDGTIDWAKLMGDNG